MTMILMCVSSQTVLESAIEDDGMNINKFRKSFCQSLRGKNKSGGENFCFDEVLQKLFGLCEATSFSF